MTEFIPIILFDGLCNLCSGLVNFLIRWETQPVLKFTSLQSDTGKTYLSQFSVSKNAINTLVLIEGEDIYTHSKAALRLLSYLKFPWPLLQIFSILPKFITDAVYRWIAKNRYQWFGQCEHCLIPSIENHSRFLP